MARPRKVWTGYGHLTPRGRLRVVLHGLHQPPLEIAVSGVAPRKGGATVFLVRAYQHDPPSTADAIRKVIRRGFCGKRP